MPIPALAGENNTLGTDGSLTTQRVRGIGQTHAQIIAGQMRIVGQDIHLCHAAQHTGGLGDPITVRMGEVHGMKHFETERKSNIP